MTQIPSSTLPEANAQSDTFDKDIWVFLKQARWPRGFVCPRCGWKHTAAWAADKAHRSLKIKKESKNKCTSKKFRTEWYGEATGRIVCQKCRLQTSLTSGTLLDGTRMSLAMIREAAECFVGAANGISAQELGRKVGIAVLSARRLIQKFQGAMELLDEDRLGGTVQVDHGSLAMGPANQKSNPPTVIMIGAEKRSKSAGRISLKMVVRPTKNSFCHHAAEMIRNDATFETSRVDIYSEYLKSFGYPFRSIKTTRNEFGDNLLYPCSLVFNHVLDILMKTYRNAVKHDNLQGYLNEIAFRWNHGDNPERAALKVMARLVQPPNTTCSPLVHYATATTVTIKKGLCIVQPVGQPRPLLKYVPCTSDEAENARP